jgi:predicted amidophosphoribosyltransferase
MGAKRCRECGAQLRQRSNSCPLCGADEKPADAKPKPDQAQTPPRPKPVPAVVSVDDYHSDLRKLRAELRRLRDAEAS